MIPIRELNFLVGFALKPAVFVLAALALAAAGRLPPGRSRTIIRLSFVAFLAGEALCGVDVYGHRATSLLFESGHDLLMAVAFALLALGLYERLLERGPCLNLECDRHGGCPVSPSECRLATRWGPLAGWALVVLAATGLVPLLAQPALVKVMLPAGVGPKSLGGYLYERTELLSLFQQKLLAVAAMTALVAGALSYFRQRRLTRFGAALALPGAGVLFFVYNRLVLVHPFLPEATLGTFLEELFELLFVALVLAWLRQAAATVRDDKRWAKIPCSP